MYRVFLWFLVLCSWHRLAAEHTGSGHLLITGFEINPSYNSEQHVGEKGNFQLIKDWIVRWHGKVVRENAKDVRTVVCTDQTGLMSQKILCRIRRIEYAQAIPTLLYAALMEALRPCDHLTFHAGYYTQLAPAESAAQRVDAHEVWRDENGAVVEVGELSSDTLPVLSDFLVQQSLSMGSASLVVPGRFAVIGQSNASGLSRVTRAGQVEHQTTVRIGLKQDWLQEQAVVPNSEEEPPEEDCWRLHYTGFQKPKVVDVRLQTGLGRTALGQQKYSCTIELPESDMYIDLEITDELYRCLESKARLTRAADNVVEQLNAILAKLDLNYVIQSIVRKEKTCTLL